MDGAAASAAASAVRWVGVSPATPLRELTGGAGLRLRAEYDALGQVWEAMSSMLPPPGYTPFDRAVSQLADAAAAAGGGGLRVPARTHVGADDNVAFFDVVPSARPPAMTAGELVALVNRAAAAAQVVAVTLVPGMSDAERARSLSNDSSNANPGHRSNGGSSGGTVPAVVGGSAGFLEQFGKYSGIILGVGAVALAAYVVHKFTD